MTKRLFLTILLLAASLCLRAQFATTGSDPASVRWMQLETPCFRIIFPRGEDSLAMVYGNLLENAGVSVGWSSGQGFQSKGKGRIPVVLHSFYPAANGSVTWAPKRMDLFTVMDPYSPTPLRWEMLLSLHEGRHLAQMLSLEKAGGKFPRAILGEMYTGALAGVFPGPVLLEGDAVVAETALSRSGRGRQGSFLSYMMPAFDSGDWRDYWRWSLGSDKVFTPDYYRVGYMLVSGTRVFFDDPLFIQEYFERTRKKGFFNLQKTVKAASGMKFKEAFRSIEERYGRIWDEEAASRAPFMPSRQVSASPWRHSAYSGTIIDGDSGIWSMKSGLSVSGALVKLDDDGSEARIRSFAKASSPLAFDAAGGRIFWSETTPNRRWPMAGSSRIRFVNISSPEAIHDLTTEGRLYNPAPSPDGNLVSASEYPVPGGSRLLVLDSYDGSVRRTVQAPDSLQFTESAWIDGRLFAAGLSESGMGVYEILSGGTGTIKTLLAPQPVELSYLRSAPKDRLSFVCDRTGVNELYLLDVDSGRLVQATSTRYGLSAPVFSPGADTLYYSALSGPDDPSAYKQGWMIYATAAEDLPMKDVSFSDIHDYKVASALASQEKTLSKGRFDGPAGNFETTFSKPRKFHRALPTLHSWAPIYFNYDNIEDISEDAYYKSASAGATVLFQNLTGDGYGFLGYGVHGDPDDGGWRHSGHFKYLYTGLLPVIEFSTDIGDRAAKEFGRVRRTDKESGTTSFFTTGTGREDPLLESRLRLYVPINLNSGGLVRGIVPQVKYTFTNDIFNDRISVQQIVTEDGKKVPKEIGHLNGDASARLTTLDLSVRGYLTRDMAPAQAYPRLGIGAEAGVRIRPGLSNSFANTAYLYTYAYLPGILQDQGIRLSATAGADIGGGPYSFPETSVSFIPRGFVDSNLRSVSNSFCPAKYRVTFDYAAPFLNLDWSALSPAVYVKKLTLSPFVDFALQKSVRFDKNHVKAGQSFSEKFYSAGVDLAFNLGNFFWLPYGTTLGVRYAFNGWSDLEGLPVNGLTHHYFGGIFSVSM